MPIPKAATEEGLVVLWSKVLDQNYSAPIIDADDVGADVPHLQAAQFAEADAQNLVVTQAYYLRPHSTQKGPPASGATYATTVLDVTRTGSAAGEMQLVAGTRFQASITSSMGTQEKTGVYVSTEPVVFAAGVRGPLPVPVRYEVVGYAGNRVPGSISALEQISYTTLDVGVLTTTELQDTPSATAARDLWTESMVGRFVVISGPGLVDAYPRRIVSVSPGPNPGDSGVATIDPPLPASYVGSGYTVTVPDLNDLFSVEQPSAAINGVDGYLDAIGDERNTPRVSGESDQAYRDRLSTLADTVSPAAIKRIATRIMGACPWKFIETRGEGLFGAFYSESASLGASLEQGFWDSGDVLTNGSVWAPSVRFFAIIVGPCALAPLGMAYDATNAPTPNAWDFGGYDLRDYEFDSRVNALWNAINTARMGGVSFQILFDPNLS